MSYEGAVRFLCPKGHLWSLDCYYEEYLGPGENKCPIPSCKQIPIWRNNIDFTNGCEKIWPDDPEHDGNCICGAIKLEIDKPAKFCTCKDCGIVHEVEPITYKIPKKENI